MNHSRGVITRIFPFASRIGENRGAQHIVGIEVSAAYTFIDHIGHAHGGIAPLHLHTHL